MHDFWEENSFRIYSQEALYFGIGINVNSDDVFFEKVRVRFYFEVDVVIAGLDLQKSVTTFMIALYILSIIVRKCFEFSVVLSFFSLSHKVFDVGVSSGLLSVLIDYLS